MIEKALIALEEISKLKDIDPRYTVGEVLPEEFELIRIALSYLCKDNVK